MVNRIAILPARSGSKRIASKNIRDFCGRPIISYILEAAQSSGLFATIHVSTEAAHIAELVQELGYGVDFLRAEHLAGDHTPILPVIDFVIKEYLNRGVSFDEIWLLMPCAALITSQDLTQASEEFKSLERGSVLLSVGEFSTPVDWAYDIAANNKLCARSIKQHSIRSQDLRRSYFDTGSFMILPGTAIGSTANSIQHENMYGFILPKFKAIDIDNEEDWIIAEAIYKYMYKEEYK